MDVVLLKFCLESVTFYQRLLTSDIEALNEDPDIKTILSNEVLESLPVHQEMERTRKSTALA